MLLLNKIFHIIQLVTVIIAGLIVFQPASAADLIDIRFGPDQGKTRIVFDLDGASDYVVSGDATGEGRIFIDFASLKVASSWKAFRSGKGHIARYGFALPGGTEARAVFELKKTAKIEEIFLIAPKGSVKKYRLVIDLVEGNRTEFLASLPAAYADLTAVIEKATADTQGPVNTNLKPATPSRKEVRAPPAALPRAHQYTVVIDAGHGGVDPGAQGQKGTFEKTVTLAAAIELEKLLKKRGGYKVVLTRAGDDTIKPDKREALARGAEANLFISIHADAIAQPAVRGASVYTLSEQGTTRSATLARAEGNYHVYSHNLNQFDDVLSGILLDKAQDDTQSASSRFAGLLIENLNGRIPLLNKTHRTGDLRVLLAPDVPAVLLEMAFISNSKDEANLVSASWRKKTMTSVADAIDGFFEANSDRQRHALNGSSGAQ